MTERFATLEQLLGGYFHQDWDIAGETDIDVILAFRQEESAGLVNDLMSEIDLLLQLNASDPSKIDDILASLGCEYYYQSAGLTGFSWLERVRSLLASPEPQPPSS
ncbi:contact-dependent growth inhibition system immunity protein [Pannonibacter phragmitetus]|uniref:contact-dependent growth inhibition system immunity protein n=1 Tax=Pannonibacter phragmitetus TaxID=121719 RepID=UPI0011C017E3|nr:contact-dependent growth inhibition system immunity protein [Pannonibacter phragmitetus]